MDKFLLVRIGVVADRPLLVSGILFSLFSDSIVNGDLLLRLELVGLPGRLTIGVSGIFSVSFKLIPEDSSCSAKLRPLVYN